MIVYSVILFAVAVLFFILGIAIYQGNTKLIHDYHQTRVKESERREYGREFAKGLFTICVTLVISGMMALFANSGAIAAASVIVLFAGLIAAIVILAKVQKKYNGGFF